jgi:hypothetical protein
MKDPGRCGGGGDVKFAKLLLLLAAPEAAPAGGTPLQDPCWLFEYKGGRR